MKKALITVLITLSSLTITSCFNMANQRYNYKNYQAMIKKKKFSFDYTKASIETDFNGNKSTCEYTYDPASTKWTMEVEETDDDNETYKVIYYETLDILGVVDSLFITSQFLNETVDRLFKMYVSDGEYRIEGSYVTGDLMIECEYKFANDGLMYYSYSKRAAINAVNVDEEIRTITYSK